MSYRLGRRSQKELIGVEPALAFLVTEAIKITTQDFTVLDGVRSMEEQRKLVARGVSKTYNSYHLNGLAVDLVAYVDGTLSWDAKYYPAIAKAMKKVAKKHGIKVDWGFDLWGWDMAHFQRTGMKPYYDIRKFS